MRRLENMGISDDILKLGDHLVVSGSPNKDPAKNILKLLGEIHRPSDGWTWSRQIPGNGSIEYRQPLADN